MLIALAVLAVVAGGLLTIIGHHGSGRFVLAGLALAFAAPLVDAAAGVLFQSLHEHGAALVVLLVVVFVGAVAIKIRPHYGTASDVRPSLKRRVDHDN